ncbi:MULTISPECIES: DUF6022 family protein [Cohnella]
MLKFAHSHLRFDIPAQPEIAALEKTERREIVAEIARMQEAR